MTERKSGFALVIALSLMAFVLVLILSLSVLIRVETVVQKQQIDHLKARENARAAAYIALGELQRHLGPDMRVSARADILSTGPLRDDLASGVIPFDADVAARFWTGVWRSDAWNPGEDVDRQGRFESWLVSLPGDDKADITSVSSAPSINDSVPLATLRAKPLSGGATEVFEVRAPLITLGNSGAYAWWVSDEGVKANPGLADSFLAERQTQLIDDIPRYLFPHRLATAATDWFENYDFNNFAIIDRLRRAAPGLSLPSLALDSADFSVEATEAFSEDSLLADFSFITFGVLSDNRKGGLRRDLSLALWRDPPERFALATGAPGFTPNNGFEADFRDQRIFNKEDYPQSEQRIRSGAATGSSFFGPRWEILRDFHNSYKKLADPTDPATAISMWEPAFGRAFYDVPRSRSVQSWEGGILFGRIILPTVLGGRSASDQDPIESGGIAAVPGQQILGFDDFSTLQPVENTRSGIYPLMQRASIFFNLDMRAVSDPSDPLVTLYAPRINAYTIVHFWNPHNVTLTSVDPQGGQSAGPWTTDIISDVEFEIIRKDALGTVLESVTFDYDQLRMGEIYKQNPSFAGYGYNVGRTEFRAEPGPNLFEFRPGEIRAFVMRDVTTTDLGVGVVAGVLRPFFKAPRITIPYEQTGGPLANWGSNMRTNDPFLFESTDIIEIKLSLQRQVDTSSVGFVLHSMANPSYNSSFTQGFRWSHIDSAGAGFQDELTVASLVNNTNSVVELGGIEMRMKAADTEATNFPSRILANFNPRAHYNHSQMGPYAGRQPPNFEIRFLQGDPFGQTAWGFEDVAGQTLLRGFWGSSDTASGENFVSLFDVPRRPPESLGQYQHAHLAFYPHQPAYPFGNSLADPHVNRTAVIDRQNNRTQMDLSWLLNDSIWDRYFLSTIDPDQPGGGRLAPLRERFVELDTSEVYALSDPNAYREVADNLLLQGAFNVNSTSEEAWAAVLGAASGEGLRYFNTEANATQTSSSLDFSFFRQSLPNGDVDTPWLGGPVSLSRTEIRRMAREMVEQVRQRGPFFSLSDFINRRLTADARGLKGAIQSAIDIAGLASPGTGGASASLSGSPFSNHATGNQADFAPGDLSQADVLTSIGPMLSVRSDTFVIRAYGQHKNLDGKNAADAWCELLVQRMPEPPKQFGRPFRILEFRWLDKDEI